MEDSMKKKFEEINSADNVKHAFITYLQASINIDRSIKIKENVEYGMD